MESGDQIAAKLVGSLISPISDLNLNECEELCRAALTEFQDLSSIQKHDNYKKNIKKPDKKPMDLFAKINSYSLNQLKNQSIRFDLDGEQKNGMPRHTWGFRGFGSMHTDNESRDYEDVLAMEILMAPIMDICIVQPGENIPDGFFRLYKTLTNKKANLNSNSGGNPIYLCFKKDLQGRAPHVTNIILIFPDKNEYVPPGYFVVQRGKNPCNINTGTSSERIYLCYKKESNGNPVTDLQLVFPSKGEETPKNFNMIEKSLSGLPANLNSNTGGLDTFLCYKQHLNRLELLDDEVAGNADHHTNQYYSPQISNHKIPVHLIQKIASTASLGTTTTSIAPIIKALPHPSRDKSPMTTINSEGQVTKSVAFKTERSDSFSDFEEADSEENPRKEKVNSLQRPRKSTLAVDEGGYDIPEDESDMEHHHVDATGTSAGIAELHSGSTTTRITNSVKLPHMFTAPGSKLVVDALGEPVPLKRRRVLKAILSCLYCRRGAVAEVALSGLLKLFKDTDFFENDLKTLPQFNTVTMVDLMIDAVCDRFDLSPDTEHTPILQFLKTIIKHSGARLAQPSQQRLFRAITFVCTSYSTKASWITAGLPMPCNEVGNDVSPFRVLKQLIWDISAQVEAPDIPIAHFLPDYEGLEGFSSLSDHENPEPFNMVRSIIEDFIDGVIDAVEISHLSELICMSISKQTVSTTSSSFWFNMNMMSIRMFSEISYRGAFITLCAICKLAWHPIRLNKDGEPVPRDLGSKLVALEAITEFCLCAGEKLRVSKVMGYQVRRIVVSCLLYNVNFALQDPRIFAKLLKIVTSLWKVWRHSVRIEFAILCDQLIIKVLQATVIQIRPIFQLIVVQEVINWFEQPHLIVEMFVNYDMDQKFVSHWNTFSYLVRTLCAIGRRLTVVTSAWDFRPGEESNRVTVTIRDVHMQALEEVSSIAKTLMDASGHAYLIGTGSLATGGGWVADDIEDGSRSNDCGEQKLENGSDTKGDSSISPLTRKRVGSIRVRREAHAEAEQLISKAINIYQEKNSLKKAVEFLLKNDFMTNTPQEIANFLRVYKNNFDPSAIGEFLGEGGVTPQEEDYWSQIRFRYTRAVSFVEMELEPALRLYLTGCGFRLPGEAQKINRFVEVFVKAFWQDNSGTKMAPFKHPDTVHLVSYAVIMLNTDLHKAFATNERRKGKKMTKEAFINNLRGCDEGENIDRDYLARIYDNVEEQPIEMPFRPSDSTSRPTSTREPAVNGANANTDNNGVSKPLTNEMKLAEEKAFVQTLCRSLRDSEDLLRSLSPFVYRFRTGVDAKISMDLVSFMFDTVWFHFHAIVNSLLSSPNSDMNVKFFALDILCYSLTSAMFLNLKMERMAFAQILKDFRQASEPPPHIALSRVDVPDDSWFQDVDEANSDLTMETIAKVHHLMVFIKDNIQQTTNYEITRQVAAKFEKRARVLENNTFFVRQGDLSKLNRGNRPTVYRFFLFSDYLIYAHLNMQNLYKVHEQLSLNAMSISDIDNDPTFTSFFISHPIKSFVVVAESPAVKQSWIRDIMQTITSCKKRESTAVIGPMGRRMSLIGRIENQQNVQQREEETSKRTEPGYSSPKRLLASNHSRYIHSNSSEDFEEEVQSVSITLKNTKKNAMSRELLIASHGSNGMEELPPIKESESSLRLEDILEEKIHADAAVAKAATDRAVKQQESLRTFQDVVRELSVKSLDNLFNAGLTFFKGMGNNRQTTAQTSPSTGNGSLSINSPSTDAINMNPSRLRLFALARQAKYGPAPNNKDDSPLMITESEKFNPNGTNTQAQSPQKSSSTVSSTNTTNSLTPQQLQAWMDCGQNMSPDDAKREFLIALLNEAPYWKYEHFI